MVAAIKVVFAGERNGCRDNMVDAGDVVVLATGEGDYIHGVTCGWGSPGLGMGLRAGTERTGTGNTAGWRHGVYCDKGDYAGNMVGAGNRIDRVKEVVLGKVVFDYLQ